jgi:hypothetical protein
MLNVIMLSVIMLSDVMLNVIMLSVVMLNVVALKNVEKWKWHIFQNFIVLIHTDTSKLSTVLYHFLYFN